MEVLYKELIPIFKKANGKSGPEIASKIAEVEIPLDLKNGLIKAVAGDNRSLNEWLFTVAMEQDQPLVWIAPIKAEVPTYVWMVGLQPQIAWQVRQWFASVSEITKNDPLLKQRAVTPPLLFVKPIALSQSVIGNNTPDEFAIFQTGYIDSPAEVVDLEQRMVINSELATLKRKEAMRHMRAVCSPADSEIIDVLEDNLELFAILHSEGHNQGHFVGKWPFEDYIKKTCILYEAIEEFKACLAAVLLTGHLPLSAKVKEAFALSVFATRFFGYGYEAYCLKNQKRETVREITVGLLFFEWLILKEVISISNGNLTIQTQDMIKELKNAYLKIDAAEAEAKTADNLREIAEDWYKIAFPLGDYSQNAKLVYTALRN